jgi:hypothetical protein
MKLQANISSKYQDFYNFTIQLERYDKFIENLQKDPKSVGSPSPDRLRLLAAANRRHKKVLTTIRQEIESHNEAIRWDNMMGS